MLNVNALHGLGEQIHEAYEELIAATKEALDAAQVCADLEDSLRAAEEEARRLHGAKELAQLRVNQLEAEQAGMAIALQAALAPGGEGLMHTEHADAKVVPVGAVTEGI